MLQRGKVYARNITFYMFIALIIGCGGGDTITAPAGSTIVTSTINITFSNDLEDDAYIMEDLVITVKGPDGKEMNGVEVYINLAWAVPYDMALVYFQIKGENYDSPLTGITDDSGNIHLKVYCRYGNTIPKWQGDITIVSSGVSAKVSVEHN